MIQSKRARTTTVKIAFRMKIRNELNRGKEKLNGLSYYNHESREKKLGNLNEENIYIAHMFACFMKI